MDAFVAIEPESGDYFVEPTFSQAAAKARTAHPGRQAAVFRVGHDAGHYMGGAGIALTGWSTIADARCYRSASAILIQQWKSS